MNDGIVIKFQQGNKKLEISIGKDVSPDQLKILQKVLEALAIESASSENKSSEKNRGESLYSKVKLVVFSFFKNGQWFSSLDLRELFEETFGESIRSTTASTYLRRLEKEGYLESRKKGKFVEYRLLEGSIQSLEKTIESIPNWPQK